MEKKFFVRASRHSKEQKKLVAEITALIDEAEKSNNKELLGIIEKYPVVEDSDGLRSLLDTIKNSKPNNGSKTKVIDDNINNDNNMSNKKDNQDGGTSSSQPEEEVVQFEEVIDAEKQSQLQQPVKHREDEFAKYKKDQTDGDDGGGGDGGSDEEEGFEKPQESGDGGTGGSSDNEPESPEGNLGDIPDDTKRKAIKKTSEIVAKIYAGVLPMLPKLIAKVPEAKVERMVWADEIDPKMKLDLGEGHVTTVAGYIEGYNAQLDEQLIITPEQQKDFQDALKDVLEEKQVAMTPSQRLVTVVVAQTFTLMAMGVQQSIMMRKHLEHWKTIHEERKQGGVSPKKDNPPTPPSSSSQTPTPTPPPTPTPSPSDNGSGSHHVQDTVQSESEEISISPEQVQE